MKNKTMMIENEEDKKNELGRGRQKKREQDRRINQNRRRNKM